LRWADLREANLSGANLSGANLSGANLSGANLSGAIRTDYPLTKAPLSITGAPFPVLIFDKHSEIGCQSKPNDEWLALAAHPSCSGNVFAAWKPVLDALIRAHMADA
jgi:uncharacterized protein YjbI with pentapeptide repeats